MGFARTVYFALKFDDAKITGHYFVHLFRNGDRHEGTVTGTFDAEKRRIFLDATGFEQYNFTLDLAYVPGDEGRADAAYGIVLGIGAADKYSGVIRMRSIDMPPNSMLVQSNGWIDAAIDCF
jgi:hypothetical protein